MKRKKGIDGNTKESLVGGGEGGRNWKKNDRKWERNKKGKLIADANTFDCLQM